MKRKKLTPEKIKQQSLKRWRDSKLPPVEQNTIHEDLRAIKIYDAMQSGTITPLQAAQIIQPC